MTAVDNGKTPDTEMDSATKDKLLSQAYTAAQARLREEHKKRFNELYADEAKKRGIEWSPRKSKEEQALDQITDLLSQFPGVAEKLAERLVSGDLSGPAF